MYRVISNYKIFSFSTYKEAKVFKDANSGKIYKKIYSNEN